MSLSYHFMCKRHGNTTLVATNPVPMKAEISMLLNTWVHFLNHHVRRGRARVVPRQTYNR
jgi:hypothetical protein